MLGQLERLDACGIENPASGASRVLGKCGDASGVGPPFGQHSWDLLQARIHLLDRHHRPPPVHIGPSRRSARPYTHLRHGSHDVFRFRRVLSKGTKPHSAECICAPPATPGAAPRLCSWRLHTGGIIVTSGGNGDTAVLSDPVLNGPYDPPSRHFEIGPKGPTGVVLEGRRPSESYIPIAPIRKGRGRGRAAPPPVPDDQLTLGLTHEQVQTNTLINEPPPGGRAGARAATEVSLRPAASCCSTGPTPTRENRVIFAQREAAETAIFLTEVAGRTRTAYADWRRRLEPENDEHNAGLPRVALKMATGSGKTVVMAMLIAWQTLNKRAAPRDARFTNRFLIVTPGITIRDRLRVLLPERPRELLRPARPHPGRPRGRASTARSIVITNYHAFLLKDAKEIKGVAKNTRQILLKGNRTTTRSRRRRRPWSAGSCATSGVGQAGEIMVLNDEAHHCYLDKPIQPCEAEVEADRTPRTKDATSDARVWFTGPPGGRQARRASSDLRPVGDAVLPDGLRLQRGLHLPVDGQRLLADGRDRVRHRQGAAHPGRRRRRRTTLVTYLRLWDYVGDELPKRAAQGHDVTRLGSARRARGRAAQPLPPLREGVRALGEGARAARRDRRRCSSSSAPTRSSPSWSTTGSPATRSSRTATASRTSPATSPLFSNVVDGSRSPGRARSSSTRPSSSPARR